MRLNADFSKRVVIRPDDHQWVDSPSAGVERMMLDRVGGEIARATSLVRFAPNSTFSEHTHGGGEEFLVLEGAFGDEHHVYPAGTYVRNPVGTSHSPSVGDQGCLILVKLYQMDDDDQEQLVVDTNVTTWSSGTVPGIEIMHLHEYGDVRVAMIRWAPNTPFKAHSHPGGEEVYVIEGAYYDEHGEYSAGSWIRSPHGSRHAPYTRDEGALIFVTMGHLTTSSGTYRTLSG
jgi:anti-sigma factor ChrR (cupin superfamily)